MRNLELCTDIAEELTSKCTRLKALTYLFSEQYTAIQLKDIPEAIQKNPEAFTDSFAIIEEMIDNILDTADTLTDELFKAKRGEAS